MIELRKTLMLAKGALDEAGVRYALIGGFGLGAHGIHRATKDIDLLAEGSKVDLIKGSLLACGFSIQFDSAEVIQFVGPGYLDILLANRRLSLEMLATSTTTDLLGVPVVSAEGLVGLKIQAYVNDSQRRLQDLADIQSLLRLPGIDLKKIKEYADLFGQWNEIEKMMP